MGHYLFTAHNVTRARRMGQLLSDGSMTNAVQRLPMGLSTQGCSYGVRVGEEDFVRALAVLQYVGLSPVKVYYHTPSGYREVAL